MPFRMQELTSSWICVCTSGKLPTNRGTQLRPRIGKRNASENSRSCYVVMETQCNDSNSWWWCKLVVRHLKADRKLQATRIFLVLSYKDQCCYLIYNFLLRIWSFTLIYSMSLRDIELSLYLMVLHSVYSYTVDNVMVSTLFDSLSWINRLIVTTHYALITSHCTSDVLSW